MSTTLDDADIRMLEGLAIAAQDQKGEQCLTSLDHRLSLEEAREILERTYASEQVEHALTNFRGYKGVQQQLQKATAELATLKEPKIKWTDYMGHFFHRTWDFKGIILGAAAAAGFGYWFYDSFMNGPSMDSIKAYSDGLEHCVVGLNGHAQGLDELRAVYLDCAAINTEQIAQLTTDASAENLQNIHTTANDLARVLEQAQTSPSEPTGTINTLAAQIYDQVGKEQRSFHSGQVFKCLGAVATLIAGIAYHVQQSNRWRAISSLERKREDLAAVLPRKQGLEQRIQGLQQEIEGYRNMAGEHIVEQEQQYEAQ